MSALIRRWVYDPNASIPVWVARKFHRFNGLALESVYGKANPGDTICYHPATGTSWVEKKGSASKPSP